MRTRIATTAMVLMVGSVNAQVWTPTDNGNLLWEKEQANQIRLVPSQIIRTPIEGVSLYTDVERGTWGRISDIGGGQYLVTESGPDEDKLSIFSEDEEGNVIWR